MKQFATGLAFFGYLALVSPTVSNQKQCLPRSVAECQGIEADIQQLTAGRKRLGWGGGRADDCWSRLWFRLNVWKAPSILETVWYSRASHRNVSGLENSWWKGCLGHGRLEAAGMPDLA